MYIFGLLLQLLFMLTMLYLFWRAVYRAVINIIRIILNKDK